MIDANDRLAYIQREIYANAEDKGFWAEKDNPLIVPTKLMLIDTETAEAMECFRAGQTALWYSNGDGLMPTLEPGGKPEGIASELADVVIRCLDLAEHLGVDLLDVVVEKVDYNAGRPHMHGGKTI